MSNRILVQWAEPPAQLTARPEWALKRRGQDKKRQWQSMQMSENGGSKEEEAVISENKPVSIMNSMQTLCWKPSYYLLLVKTAAQHSLYIRAQPIGRSNFASSFDLINTLLPLHVVV